MKKNLACFACLLYSVCLFSQAAIQADIGYGSGIGLEPPVYGSVKGSYIWKPLFFSAGVHADAFSANLALEIRVTPFTFKYATLGFSYKFNAMFYHKIRGQEFDNAFLFNVRMHTKKENPFIFKISLGVNLKPTLFKLKEGDLSLFEISPLLHISFQKVFLKTHSIRFTISSYEDFYYPLFFLPLFSLDYAFKINKNISVGIKAAIQYTDFFTLSGTYDGFKLAASCSYFFGGTE